MFKPKLMARTLVVGPLDLLEKTINCLHSLDAAHLIESKVSQDIFRHGRALPEAGKTAENLVRVRSILNALDISGDIPKGDPLSEKELSENLDDDIGKIESRILQRHENLAKTDSEIASMKGRLLELEPFADMGVSFDLLHGYESLECFVGRSRERLGERIDAITPEYLFVHGAEERGVYALFVPAGVKEKVEELLRDAGFNAERVPAETGDPIAMVGECKERISRLEKKRAKLREEIKEAEKKFHSFLFAAEEYLKVRLEKAEAPLHFTCSDRAFIIDFWVPQDNYTAVSERLERDTGGALLITALDQKNAPHQEESAEAEEPPTAYDNPRGIRGFETLINMFTTPRHDEIDPTPVISFGFPIMFGFMIGDLAYGLILMVIGAVLALKKRMDIGVRTMGWYLIVGGFWASLFGAVMFGDFFGIPFAASHGERSWSTILGAHLPHGLYHKTSAHAIPELLIMTVLGGCVYMLVGYFIGFLNEIRHGIKHALVKAGFFLVLLGFGMLVLAFDKSTGFSEMGSGIAGAVPFLASFTSIIVFMLAGVALVLSGAPMEILEFVGPFANMVSYARLAAIGVAKGFLAASFNNMGIDLLHKGGGWIALAVIVLVGAHLMVLLLGVLSAFIQSLRLNYYEMFIKFVKGGGTPYAPFGWRPRFVRPHSEKT